MPAISALFIGVTSELSKYQWNGIGILEMKERAKSRGPGLRTDAADAAECVRTRLARLVDSLRAWVPRTTNKRGILYYSLALVDEAPPVSDDR
jgi:hypothetical protein